MTELDTLSYDIEQLYIEGFNVKSIARELECAVETVVLWLEHHKLDHVS